MSPYRLLLEPCKGQGIRVHCCVYDWLCNVQRILAICEDHHAGSCNGVRHDKGLEYPIVSPMPQSDASIRALYAPTQSPKQIFR